MEDCRHARGCYLAPAADLVLVGLVASTGTAGALESALGNGPAGGLPLLTHDVLGAVVLGALTRLLAWVQDCSGGE